MRQQRKASFVIDSRDSRRIVIRDVGPWDEHPTVTNDAEGVVRHLVAHEGLMDGMALLYYDSDGVLSELRHAGGRFTGFAHYPQVS